MRPNLQCRWSCAFSIGFGQSRAGLLLRNHRRSPVRQHHRRPGGIARGDGGHGAGVDDTQPAHATYPLFGIQHRVGIAISAHAGAADGVKDGAGLGGDEGLQRGIVVAWDRSAGALLLRLLRGQGGRGQDQATGGWADGAAVVMQASANWFGDGPKFLSPPARNA